MTEPDMPAEKPCHGWVFYDGDCDFCMAIIRRFSTAFAGKGFAAVPLQAPWVKAALGLKDDAELLAEMRVLTRTGEIYGGAEAVLYLARQYWWLRPLVWLSALPGARGLLHRAYQFVALRRRCSSNSCVGK